MMTASTQRPALPASALLAGKVQPRQLWQVPVFVVGLVALLGVWLSRPSGRVLEGRVLERGLESVRAALAETPAEAGRALKLGQDALSRCERFPERAGEAHFLVGSSYLFLAGQAGSADAAELWQQARTHLEEAQSLGVPETDRPSLLYRLGKTWFQAGVDAKRVLDCLAPAVEQAADDPVEGFGMLAQTYLHLPVPDVRAALETTRKQLALPTDNEVLLAPARLLQGELLLYLKEPAEAAKVLERLGTDLDPALLPRTRTLKARCYHDQGLWGEAAKLWEEILADQSQPLAEPGWVLFYLGQCYRAQGNSADAGRVWESALAYRGEEGQAAAFHLAELRLAGQQPATALDCFERALRDVTTPAGLQNRLVDLPQARRALELGCQRYREMGDFDRAQKLARLYEKLALPGVARQRGGQAAEAWALECRSKQSEEEARLHFREAAAAYEAVADAVSAPAEKAQWLRRSSERYLQSQEPARALVVLKRFLEVETAPEPLAEAWFNLAQVTLTLNDEASAVAAFRKCIEFPGPFAFRARHRLAQIDIENGFLNEAEEILKQNLAMTHFSPNDDTHKKSLFTLATLMYQRSNHHQAAVRLQEALDRYPSDPRAVEARYQLAECYRQLSTEENQKQSAKNLTAAAQTHYREQYRHWLKQSAANYQKLTDDLSARQAVAPLPVGEETLLRQADFALAECRFDLGQYEEALQLYQTLAARYRRQVEELIALRQIWRYYWVQRKPDKARDTVKQVQAALQGINDKTFASHPAKQTRQDWLQWLEWAGKQ